MKKYEILEHRADLKIRAFGKTKEELFLNMLLAMFECQKPEIENKRKIRRKIEIKSIDLPTLLVDFLNEILYLSQVNKEIYFEVKFKKFTDNEIKSELIGKKIKRVSKDIKAATYHDLEIKKGKNKILQATVLFDI